MLGHLSYSYQMIEQNHIKGCLRFLMEIIRSQFRENSYVRLQNRRNGGGGFDVRFARWIYRRVISQMARYLSRFRNSIRTMSYIPPGFMHPTHECFFYFLTIPHLFSAFYRFYRFYRLRIVRNKIKSCILRLFIIRSSRSFIATRILRDTRSMELNFSNFSP